MIGLSAAVSRILLVTPFGDIVTVTPLLQSRQRGTGQNGTYRRQAVQPAPGEVPAAGYVTGMEVLAGADAGRASDWTMPHHASRIREPGTDGIADSDQPSRRRSPSSGSTR
jgi:hypothetical protein